MDYKKRNIILGIAFIILFIVIYQLVIKRTFEYNDQYYKLKKEKALLNNAASQIQNLQKKNNQLDVILQRDNISILSSFEQILLKKINIYTKELSLEIIDFKKPHIFSQANLENITYTFEVKGNYISLLKFLKSIEKGGLGEITSTTFLKKKDYRRNNNYLILKIYLKKIK